MKVQEDLSWMDLARCRGYPVDMFFLKRGDDPRSAQALCSHCPVKSECIQYALRKECYDGIFGGLTHRGRLRWQKERMAETRRAS